MRARHGLVLLGGIVIVVGVLLVAMRPVQAQSAIQIVSEEINVNFPYSVDFDLSAHSEESLITSIRLFWQAGPEDVFNVRVLDVVPAQTVSVAVPLNALFLDLPPFAQIAFRWQIRDEQGHELVTETRTVEYQDTRSDWRELDNEHFRMLWYGYDEAFAHELYQIVEDAYFRLETAFGVELERRPTVVIYPDRQVFAEFQMSVGNGYNVIGRYFPGHDITVNLVSPDMPRSVYAETLAHELSHLYSDNFYVGFTSLPLWLEEGLATYNEVTSRVDNLARVRQAASAGNLISFVDLPNAIRSPNIAITNLAYAEGATVFEYIIESWGQQGLSDFLGAFRRTSSADEAMSTVFDQGIVAFELGWRAWLGFPVAEVPQLLPTPTLRPFDFPTPVFMPPGGS